MTDRRQQIQEQANEVSLRASQYAMATLGGDADWEFMVLLDTLQLIVETDLSSEVSSLMHDLRMNEVGYPLNSEGDPIPNGARRYVPVLKRRKMTATVEEWGEGL